MVLTITCCSDFMQYDYHVDGSVAQGARTEPLQSVFEGLTTVPTFSDGLSRVRNDGR